MSIQQEVDKKLDNYLGLGYLLLSDSEFNKFKKELAVGTQFIASDAIEFTYRGTKIVNEEGDVGWSGK